MAIKIGAIRGLGLQRLVVARTFLVDERRMYLNEMVRIIETIRSVYEVVLAILSFEILQGQRPEIYVYKLLTTRKYR